ncbi:helix-turn-helix transcriptional regulator [Niveispirillum irakense]|uniref:helix-turn-helix transcriptional regulator n=1 Tax=Niveispirillum irakense TaxID=34011 RepID=UPI00041128F4|nr:LuxR C-terminal-related transcriptional regulator [Niveispirillum irakense]
MRVAVLTDDVMVRRRLMMILAREAGVTPVLHGDVAGLAAGSADAILIDPRNFSLLRDRDPVASLRLSRQAHFIFILSLGEVLDTADILPFADAWIFTDENLDKVPALLRLGKEGHCLLPAQFLSQDGIDRIRLALLPRLSDTEYRCLLELGRGLNNRDIAQRLTMSEPTVKSTVRATLTKMHFRNRTEAGVFAARKADDLVRQSA